MEEKSGKKNQTHDGSHVGHLTTTNHKDASLVETSDSLLLLFGGACKLQNLFKCHLDRVSFSCLQDELVQHGKFELGHLGLEGMGKFGSLFWSFWAACLALWSCLQLELGSFINKSYFLLTSYFLLEKTKQLY